VYLSYQYEVSDNGNHEPSSLMRLDKHTKHIQVDVGNAANTNSSPFAVYLKVTLFHPLLLYVVQRMRIAVSDLMIGVIVWNSTN